VEVDHTMTTFRYRRAGGQPPSDAELLDLDGAEFTLVRTIGGPRVGCFAGRVLGDVVATVDRLAAAVAAQGDLATVPPRDAALETLELGGVRLRGGHHQRPDGAWAEAIALARRLVDELTDSPVAALGLDVVDDGATARVRHLGDEPVVVDLAGATARADHTAGDGRLLGSWQGDVHPLAVNPVETGPGWALDVGLVHGFTLAPGDVLTVILVFGLVVDGAAVAHRLTNAAFG
jgi:hypothetical protein